MADAITEKATCKKCGVDARDGTAFCYNCGSKIVELPKAVAETAGSIDDGIVSAPTEDKSDETVLIHDTPQDSDKMSRAADQRRKSRVGLRKTREYAWEPTDDSGRLLLVAVVIFTVALVVVFVTVIWK